MATLLPCSDVPDASPRFVVGGEKGFTLKRLCEILDPNCKAVRFIESPHGSPEGYFAVVDRDADLVGLGVNDLFAMSSCNRCIVRGPVILLPRAVLLCDPEPRFNFCDPSAPTLALPDATLAPAPASGSMAALDFALSWFDQAGHAAEEAPAAAPSSLDVSGDYYSPSLNYSRY